MDCTAKIGTHLSPQAAGTAHFAMDVDEVPAAVGSRPDRLSPVSGPQEQVQRHTVEQIVDSALGLPILNARVRPRLEQAAGVLTGLSQLEQVRRRTAMEVFRSFERVWRTLTWDELRSMVTAGQRPPAQRGKQMLGKAEACGDGAVRARAADPVEQQSLTHENAKVSDSVHRQTV